MAGALLATVFGAFAIYLGTVTRPWRTVKDRPRVQWTIDTAGSLLLAGIGVLALLAAWGAALWLLRLFAYVWVLLLAAAATAWLSARWREAHAPQPVAPHAPRPLGALTAVFAWLFGLPAVVAVVLSLSLYLWHRVAPSAADPVSSADLAAALAPPLLVATVMTAPLVWLAQAVRRRGWEERQRAHEHRLTGLAVPPIPSRWVTFRRVLGI